MVFAKKITNITLVCSFKKFKNKALFVILIKIGNGCGDFSPIRESGTGIETGKNPRQGNGNGDGLNYVPIPVPIPEQGLIFLPVPVPVGDEDFFPLRSGPRRRLVFPNFLPSLLSPDLLSFIFFKRN